MQRRTKLQMEILARQAERLVFAFSHKESQRILLLPVEDYGSPAFEGAVRESMSKGFAAIGILALCSTAEGKPLIEYEPMPGVADADMEAAKQSFVDHLMAEGILKPDTPIN